ncbi:MAG: hypothetical protein ACREAD_03000 [Nitrosopumilaceae archaeon]
MTDDGIDWIVKEENYQGNTRYHKVEKVALFKIAREEQGEKILTEMANEIICWEFGKRLEIPIAEIFLGVLTGKGLGLFSIWVGTQPLNVEDKNQISNLSNYDKLKELFVFDQWVYNYDRGQRHFVTGQDPTNAGKLITKGIDHGHTLNDYNGTKLQSNANLLLEPASGFYFDGSFNNTLELKPIVEKIEKISDKEIDEIISFATDTIIKFNPTQLELEKVQSNEQHIKNILKSRRTNLRTIIEKYCKLANKTIQWD